MARKKSRRKRRAPVPGGQVALSRKIARVRREDPSLTVRQAAGKAAGILRSNAKKKRKTR